MNLTTDNWIAIIGIIIPVLLLMFSGIRNGIVILFNKIMNRKIEVVSDVIDERFSSLNYQTKPVPFLDKNGYLTVDAILKNNYSQFKDDLPNAGELRGEEVCIANYKNSKDTGGTRPRLSEKEKEKEKEITNLMPSKEIDITLNDIISNWNKKVKKVTTYSDIEKIKFISRFHFYFETIHPFFDGNGRIGRMLISEQSSFLFDKIINFEPNQKKYYEAINLATKGDESLLQLIIQGEVQK